MNICVHDRLYRNLKKDIKNCIVSHVYVICTSSQELLTYYAPCLAQVSEELIRVAILWHELWHEGLEEASRLYFGERDIKGMFSTLEPLHNMVERGPQTLKETSFNQVIGIF